MSISRQKNIEYLKANPDDWDFIIIGGGATGLGVAVDAALLHNVPDADLVQGLFVEQLQKRRFNGLLGKICHTHLRLFCTYSLGKSIIADFSPADNPPKVPKMGHTIPAVMTGGN